ncbi:MAG: CoA transferase [Alphaproteobacteria bacterium]|nr:CoA transferase [Alphaproteobacteria bacterium]
MNRVATVNRAFNNGPGDIYRCKDGWIVATVIGPPMFKRWCEMVGEPGWVSDPRFADDQARADNGEAITAKMTAWCAARSCKAALADLEQASIVAGQVYAPQQTLDEPHIRDAGLLAERDFPGVAGTLPLAPTPIELSETPGTYRRRAPLTGEHTDEILESLGYTAAEIGTLRADKVV